MRSLLIVPADRPDTLAAALAARPGAIVFDLGDPSMGSDARAEARRSAAGLLARAAPLPDRPRLLVRVAPLPSGSVDADLDAIIGAGPDAVLLPGAVGAHDVQHLGCKLAVREAERGIASGTIGILAVGADTARGVLALGTMPTAGPRLVALAFDGRSLAAETACGATAAGTAPSTAARGLLVLAAAAAGVAAVDLSASDPGTLARDCDAARRDGFSARLAGSPAEVATIEAGLTW